MYNNYSPSLQASVRCEFIQPFNPVPTNYQNLVKLTIFPSVLLNPQLPRLPHQEQAPGLLESSSQGQVPPRTVKTKATCITAFHKLHPPICTCPAVFVPSRPSPGGETLPHLITIHALQIPGSTSLALPCYFVSRFSQALPIQTCYVQSYPRSTRDVAHNSPLLPPRDTVLAGELSHAISCDAR